MEASAGFVRQPDTGIAETLVFVYTAVFVQIFSWLDRLTGFVAYLTDAPGMDLAVVTWYYVLEVKKKTRNANTYSLRTREETRKR